MNPYRNKQITDKIYAESEMRTRHKQRIVTSEDSCFYVVFFFYKKIPQQYRTKRKPIVES